MRFKRRSTDKVVAGDHAPAPDEVGFFSRVEWQKFLTAVHHDMERRGLVAVVDGTNLSRPGSGWSASLISLARTCYHEPDQRWDDAISSHFDSLLTSADANPAADLAPSSPSPLAALAISDVERISPQDARAALRVRIYPPEFTSEGRIGRAVAPGLVAGLAIDLPDVVESVSPEQLQAWDLEVDEAFRLGYSNARANDRPSIGGHHPEGEPGLLWLTGNSFFTTTNVLWLDDLIGPLPEAGALVALPHRHAIIVHPMTDLGDAIQAVNLLLLIAHSAFREGPGSLSPSLYWWSRNKLVHLPGELQGDDIRFRPPEEFLEALDRLAASQPQRQTANS